MSILNRSALASVQWNDNGFKHIRVYYQDAKGAINEVAYDGNTGWHISTNNPIGFGKLNTGITATCWASGTQIRLYFLNDNDEIIERAFAHGSWETNIIGWTAAPFSRIGCTSAIDASGAASLRLYYQDAQLKLRELIFRDTPRAGWVEGTDNLPTALVGTSIGAASNPNYPGWLWVYYQDTALEMKEFLYKGSEGTSWGPGTFVSKRVYPPGASISATMWNKPPKIRVLTVDQTNTLCVTGFDTNKWSATKTIGAGTIPDSDVVAISVGGGPEPVNAVRVYYQMMGTTITEEKTVDADSWTVGAPNIM